MDRSRGPGTTQDPYATPYYQMHRAMHARADINDAVRTVEVNNEFIVTPETLSDLRDIVYQDGGYVRPTSESTRVSYNEDTYVVSTDAATNSRTTFETADIGRYRSGSVGMPGLYFQKDDPPVGTSEWGYGREPQTIEGFDVGRDRLFWRETSAADLSFVIERQGVETEIPQSNWAYDNNDPREVTDENGDVSGIIVGVDDWTGDGPFGFEWDRSEGYVYRPDFVWYGGGVIVPKVAFLDKWGRQMSVPAFVFKPVGQTSFSQPNQPLFAALDNGATATADSARVAGRQFSTAGGFQDTRRDTSDYRGDLSLPGSDGAEGLLLCFRRKPGYEGIEIGIGDLVVDLSAAGLLKYVIYPDFGNQTPSWEPPSEKTNRPDETAIQIAVEDGTGDPLTIDTTVGTEFGGTLLTGNKNATEPVSGDAARFPVPRNEPVAIVGKNLTGSSTTADVNTRFIETW